MRAFISAVTLSPSLVTVLISSTDTGALLASVSVPRPAQLQRQYALNPAVIGVGGWIVFGSYAANTELQSWRFSEPEQALLMAHTAVAYTRLPVQSIGVHGVATRLRGRVRLQGGADMETVKRTFTISGTERDVAVLRLKDTTGDTNRQILEEYVGECGRRPESRNCPNGTPIELVNTVSPDCCGRIYVELRGGLDVFPISNTNGVILDLPIELDDACVSPTRLPDSRGRLPNEYQDQCANSSTPTALALGGRFAMPSPSLEGTMFAFNGLLTVNRGNWSWQSIIGPPARVIVAYGISVINYRQQLMIKTLHRHELAEGDTLLLFTADSPTTLVTVTEVLDNNRFVVDQEFDSQHVFGWLNAASAIGESLGYEYYWVQQGTASFAVDTTDARPKVLLFGDAAIHHEPGQPVDLPDGSHGIAIWEPPPEIGVDDYLDYGVSAHSIATVGELDYTTFDTRLRLPLLPKNEDITSSGYGTESLVGPDVGSQCEIITTVTLAADNPMQLYFAIVLTAANGDTVTLELSQQPAGTRVRLLQRIGNSSLVRFTTKFDYDVATDTTPLELLLQMHSHDDKQYVSGAVLNPGRGEVAFISAVELQGEWPPDSTVSLVSRQTRATIHNFNLNQ